MSTRPILTILKGRAGRAQDRAPGVDPAPLTSQNSRSSSLVLGVAAWLLVVGFTWPLAFSFADDIGYVGQAKILLAGRVLPLAEDAGIWTSTEMGRVSM